MKHLLSIIAPMYCEQGLVEEFVVAIDKSVTKKTSKYNIEIVLVDDGSTDSTFSEMQNMRDRFPNQITIVQLTRNFGLEGAIFAGLAQCSGNYAVVMDADLQDPPHVILDLLDEAAKGFDIVNAIRKDRPNDNFFKKTTASLFYKIFKLLAHNVSIEEEAANFRLLNRRAIDILLSMPEKNPVFRVAVPLLGMKTSSIYYVRQKRFLGRSKYKFFSLLKAAVENITSFSTLPLRLPAAFSFLILAVLFTLTGLRLSGLTISISSHDLLLILLLIAFALMISLAFVAEYIRQIFIEVKGRPNSLIYTVEKAENKER